MWGASLLKIGWFWGPNPHNHLDDEVSLAREAERVSLSIKKGGWENCGIPPSPSHSHWNPLRRGMMGLEGKERRPFIHFKRFCPLSSSTQLRPFNSWHLLLGSSCSMWWIQTARKIPRILIQSPVITRERVSVIGASLSQPFNPWSSRNPPTCERVSETWSQWDGCVAFALSWSLWRKRGGGNEALRWNTLKERSPLRNWLPSLSFSQFSTS